MRIVILTQYFAPEPGASQARLAGVSTQLAALGHEVEIVTAVPNYPYGCIATGYRGTFYRRELWDGIPVHRLWCYAAQGAGLKRILNYVTFCLASVFGLLKCRKPDYIFVESPPLLLSIPGILFSRLWRVPVIFNVADLWPDAIVDMGLMRKGWRLSVLWALERWTYRKANLICAVTRGIYKALKFNKGVPANKLLFLPNGIDTTLYYPTTPDEQLRRELALEGKCIVLYLGTHSFASQLESVMDAAVLLKDDPNIHFLFVGDGSAKSDLMKSARERHFSNVTFCNAVAPHEVRRYYSISICGLVSVSSAPVFLEARPAKSLAIMACGKPILFVAGNGRRSFVADIEAGIDVPMHSPLLLVDAIRRLAGDPGLAETLGKNGRHYVEENFTWAPLVRSWLQELSCARVH